MTSADIKTSAARFLAKREAGELKKPKRQYERKALSKHERDVLIEAVHYNAREEQWATGLEEVALDKMPLLFSWSEVFATDGMQGPCSKCVAGRKAVQAAEAKHAEFAARRGEKFVQLSKAALDSIREHYRCERIGTGMSCSPKAFAKHRDARRMAAERLVERGYLEAKIDVDDWCVNQSRDDGGKVGITMADFKNRSASAATVSTHVPVPRGKGAIGKHHAVNLKRARTVQELIEATDAAERRALKMYKPTPKGVAAFVTLPRESVNAHMGSLFRHHHAPVVQFKSVRTSRSYRWSSR